MMVGINLQWFRLNLKVSKCFCVDDKRFTTANEMLARRARVGTRDLTSCQFTFSNHARLLMECGRRSCFHC